MTGVSLAALPMYDLAELRPVTDAWWAGLARHLRAAGIPDAPPRLARDLAPEAVLASPRLLLAQTCGYPLTHALAGRLRLVATPAYRAPGCDGASYRSLIVVREAAMWTGLADVRGRVVAVNGLDSHSGCNVLRLMLAPLAAGGRFLGRVLLTGSHRASLEAVATGAADLAAIDCVSHALLARHAPAALAGTRVLVASPPAAGLPYVTRADASDDVVERLWAGLSAALADPVLAPVREALLIAGAERLPLAAYAVIPAMRRAAAAMGYPALS